MKNNKKNIFLFVVFAVATALIFFNRHSTQAQIDAADNLQLSVTVNGKESLYSYNENHQEYTSFDTQMKRKNGDVFDKNYSGMPLSVILDDMDIEITDNITISVVCADQYEIRLTASEVLEDGNIWLVTKENGENLAEADGHFMMVVNNDEFSTRWAKSVVRVKIN